METWFCRVTTAGTPTISYNFANVGLNYIAIKGAVFRGGTSAAAVNVHAAANQAAPGTSANAITSGSVTSTVGGCLVWAVTNVPEASASLATNTASGTGYTDIGKSSGTHGAIFHDEYLLQASAGAVTGTFTDATNGATYSYLTGIVVVSP